MNFIDRISYHKSLSQVSIHLRRSIGVFAGVGVMLALFYTIILIPALLAIIPVKAKNRPQAHRSIFDRLLDKITDFSTGHPRVIVAASVALIIISLIAATRLNFSHDV